MGAFDDIPTLEQSQVPVTAVSPPPPPQEDVFTATARGAGNAILGGQAPALGGYVNYAMEAGAPGSYERGVQRSQDATTATRKGHPDAYSIGQVLGTGFDATMGAMLPPVRAAISLPGMIARRIGGAALRPLVSALRGEPPPAGGAAPPGPTGQANWPPKLARAFKQSKESPPPGTGKLSKEMLDALKRGKFRHDYSTGEWRDFLAPGE